MRLSRVQAEVMWRLQAGWAMRTGWIQDGFVNIITTTCLQRDGHGKGGPTFRKFTIATVRSLKKKGLIKQEGIVYVRDLNWVLTEEGKNFKLKGG